MGTKKGTELLGNNPHGCDAGVELEGIVRTAIDKRVEKKKDPNIR